MREDLVLDTLTVALPTRAVLLTTAVVVPTGTVDQQNQEVDWVEVRQNVRKSYK